MKDLDPKDVETCLRVLQAVVDDRSLLAQVDELRRRELLMAAGVVSRPARPQLKRLAKTLRRQKRAETRKHDAQVVATAANRAARRSSAFLLPASTVEPAASEAAEAAGGPETELKNDRNCYICKEPYRRVHHFYDSMCPACAELNYKKRLQTARLDGRVALLTGARIKIGYQAALMLLRAGARVIATTRFPNDAALRYAKEPDYEAWRDRLELHGIDLRHVPSVELFARHLSETAGRLDILINNAAQTVRRPPAFYEHLVAAEEQALSAMPSAVQPLLQANAELRQKVAGVRTALAESGPGLMRFSGAGAGLGLLEPARLSQVPCAPDDTRYGAAMFPAGQVDADAQQVDLRPMNSWRLRLEDVPTPELLEVHLVNAVAPFVLNSKLKPLMMRERTDEKHIVNVSAMEAQFARNKKTDKHPHTNMAKAALNMMTRTSAQDYANHGIFMNSVDTGWVTDEDPVHHSLRKVVEHDFHPPLDSIDGAARVIDPIFTGLLTGHHVWGHFLKDYQPVRW